MISLDPFVKKGFNGFQIIPLRHYDMLGTADKQHSIGMKGSAKPAEQLCFRFFGKIYDHISAQYNMAIVGKGILKQVMLYKVHTGLYLRINYI